MRTLNLLLGALALVSAIAFGTDTQEMVASRSVPGHLAQPATASPPTPDREAGGQVELPRVRSLTPVPEGGARRPFGRPGADDAIRGDARGLLTDIPIDPGPEAGPGPVIMSPEGFQVVPGTAEAGRGPRVAYTVEVEPSVDVDPLSVAAAVEEALHDPRSWAGEASLQRVDDIDAATIRVVLAEPSTVDELCAQAGLDTRGRFSCWNGTFASLNAMRWSSGAADFDDLTTYRRYLINHEFGHGLGYGHLDCEAPGALAPVMMQQTKGTGGCEANGWPYPELSPP